MTEMLECAYILKCIVCLQSLKGVHRDVGSGISIPAPARSLTVNQCACYIRSVTLQHGVHMTNLELGLSCRDSRHGFTVQLHCHTKKGFLRAVAILMAGMRSIILWYTSDIVIESNLTGNSYQ